MIYTESPLPGVYRVSLDPKSDERGFFSRVFCSDEFQSQGLTPRFVQVNDSLAVTKGTLRGLHYQLAPKSEVKLVRCIRGALWDVCLDLRPDSPTHGQYYAEELTAENRYMMYVPNGCAHGFITLTDDTEAFYFADATYAPDHERGVRWDDPRFRIEWPIDPVVISDKDQNHPDFDPAYHLTDELEAST